jgi:hypothetical protein
MSNEETVVSLSQLLSKHVWFDSVGVDKFGKLVVYISESTKEIMAAIPDKFENKRVVWQYASSKSEVVAAKYAVAYKPAYHTPEFQITKPLTDTVKILNTYSKILEEPESEKELNINFLISELDRLEKLCGSRVLQDLFYEVHDGKNSVTTLKNKFPEIYDDVLDLYEEFGFDIMYNELDG